MLTSIKIANRINAHLGIPPSSGKKPVVIHLHERYGIVQHTTELGDDEVLLDLDAVVAHLRTIPQADMNKIAMSGVCQTGRQPILAAAKRDYLKAAVVLYGAVYDADWKSHPIRPMDF